MSILSRNLLLFVFDSISVLFSQQTGVHHAQNPDQYRGIFGSDGLKYARDVDDMITYGTSGRVAAFIAEAIQVLILFECNGQKL